MVVKKRTIKKILLMLVDATFIFGIYFLGEHSFIEFEKSSLLALLIIIVVKIIIFIIFKLYNFLFSHVGIAEFFKIVIAILLSNIILLPLLEVISIFPVEWKLFFYSTPLEILAITGIRFYKRIFSRFKNNHYNNGNKDVNTIIIGAGSAGKFLYDSLIKNKTSQNRVVCYVDDSLEKQNNSLNGVPIFGPIEKISEYIELFSVEEVIIAIANIDRIRLSEIVEYISKKSVKIKRLPLLLEDPYASMKKVVDVNIEDLLSRSIVSFDNHEINNFINGKTVLVTGGGGSIGSELCQQILSYNPKVLIIFDIYENTTYETQIELVKRIKEENRTTVLNVIIGSVYNYERIKAVFEEYNPDLVFHAAAYKHVPLMESSPVEAIRTNVLGTYNVASLANDYQIKKMILVSSDKAVRPTNVMGATKAICELIIQYFDTMSLTSYAAVRFGNVLGSHGSVVPLFKRQIEEGGPITITHPDITRFFMIIPEAVNLILQSAVYAEGGEIFILDMGEPIKIVDLADKMIRLSGLIPNKDIAIEYIGLRPGEKLYEELLIDIEKNTKTANDKIYIEEKREIYDIETFIKKVKDSLDRASDTELKDLIQSIIKGYHIYTNDVKPKS